MDAISIVNEQVIIDEDIFRTIFRTESIPMQILKKIACNQCLPDSVKSRLNGICLKRGYHKMDEFEVNLDEKQLPKFWGKLIRAAASKIHLCGQRKNFVSDRRVVARLQIDDAFSDSLQRTISKGLPKPGD